MWLDAYQRWSPKLGIMSLLIDHWHLDSYVDLAITLKVSPLPAPPAPPPHTTDSLPIERSAPARRACRMHAAGSTRGPHDGARGATDGKAAAARAAPSLRHRHPLCHRHRRVRRPPAPLDPRRRRRPHMGCSLPHLPGRPPPSAPRPPPSAGTPRSAVLLVRAREERGARTEERGSRERGERREERREKREERRATRGGR